MVLTQQAFADHVGITQSAVSDLVARGVVDLGQGLDAARLAYIRHLREMAAGRAADGDLDLATERAGLARAQREKVELQNAVTRRELAPLTLIEQVLGQAGARVAAILEAIPGAVRRRNSALTAEDVLLITKEVAKARNIAAAISLDAIDATDDEVAA